MSPKPVVKEDIVAATASTATTTPVATETKTDEAAASTATATVETVVTNDEIGEDALGTTTEQQQQQQEQQQPKQQFTTAVLPSLDNSAPISSNAYVSGSNMNGGCTMTGRPSSRVLAPPGGHTSFKLG